MTTKTDWNQGLELDAEGEELPLDQAIDTWTTGTTRGTTGNHHGFGMKHNASQ